MASRRTKGLLDLLQRSPRLGEGCAPAAAVPAGDPDAALVAQFKAGDRGAFDVLVERHRVRMFHLACRLVGPEAADDATQDLFIAAFRALPGFRGQARFSTWLYRVALNTCSRHLKAATTRSRRELVETDGPGDLSELPDCRDNPEEMALRAELQEYVRQAIARLPAKHRDVIVLRDMQQLSYQEIAAVLGCPIGTVRSRIHHATAELATRLRAYLDGK